MRHKQHRQFRAPSRGLNFGRHRLQDGQTVRPAIVVVATTVLALAISVIWTITRDGRGRLAPRSFSSGCTASGIDKPDTRILTGGNRRNQGSGRIPLAAGARSQHSDVRRPGGKASNLPIDGTTCDGESMNTGPSLNIGPGGTVDEKRYVISDVHRRRLNPRTPSPCATPLTHVSCTSGKTKTISRTPYVWSDRSMSGPVSTQPALPAWSTGSGSGSSAPLIIGTVAGVLVLLAGGYFWLRYRGRGRSSAIA